MAESTGSRRTIDDDFWVMKPNDCQTCHNNLGGVSVWCKKNSLWTFTCNVRDGDRLELVSSSLHSWAIYNYFHWREMSVVLFINRANEEWKAYTEGNILWKSSFPASEDVIVVTSIIKFLTKKGNEVRINNMKDKDWPPLGTWHLCKAFTDQIKDIDAGLKVPLCRKRFKDSEHFVNYCRYDRDNQYMSRGIVSISEWYNEANSERFISEVREGDRLEFRCNSPYECWGIYIGQWGDDLEQVVLFAQGEKVNSATSTEGLKPKLWVKSIRMHLVDGYDAVRINNGGDRRWQPLPREDILKQIRSQLPGKARTHYECKASFKDSEGFVNYCRYDDWRINFGLVSEWNYYLPAVQVGDRLEFHRTAMPYAHWGIYVGKWGDDYDQVVHFAPGDGKGKIFSKKKSSGSRSSAKGKPVFCVESFVIILGKFRINNDKDHMWPPFDKTYILDEIERQLKSQSDGHEPVYNLFSNNCEHFVNHCRYGKHHSDQVSRFSKFLDPLTEGQ